MSVFVLKLIAMATMFVDHIAAVFGLEFNILGAHASTYMLRAVGRVAFPIFAFLAAEGCRKTRNIWCYSLRLLVFALVSELPFDLLFASSRVNFMSFVFFDWTHQNIFFTLALGVCAVACIREAHARLLKTKPGWPTIVLIAAAVLCVAFGHLLHTDYQSVGVALIAACYLAKTKRLQALVLAAFGIVQYHGDFSGAYWMLMGGVFAAALLVLCYNGQKGPSAKYAFYAFYPGHLLAILAACIFLFMR